MTCPVISGTARLVTRVKYSVPNFPVGSIAVNDLIPVPKLNGIRQILRSESELLHLEYYSVCSVNSDSDLMVSIHPPFSD